MKLLFYCPVIDEMSTDDPKGSYEGYAEGFDIDHCFGPFALVWHVLWCNGFWLWGTLKDLSRTRRVTKESIVATMARRYVADKYTDYEKRLKRTSLAEERSFMELCYTTVAVYGPPKGKK